MRTFLHSAKRIGARVAPRYFQRKEQRRESHLLCAQWEASARLLFAQWVTNKQVFLDGRFTGWNNQFAAVRDVAVDFSKSTGSMGGESVEEALHQSEEEELHRYGRGFFQLEGVSSTFTYDLPFHLMEWIRSFSGTDGLQGGEVEQNPGIFLGITRYEFANLFHVMTDLYNAFLVLRFLNIDRREVTAILMDGHPYSVLDQLFEGLFGNCKRIGEFKGLHRFDHYIFNMVGYQSPLIPSLLQGVPYSDDFRNWILGAFHVEPRKTTSVDRITFIWRHDYLAHPRNPSGFVERQINNEVELIEDTRRHFPGIHIEGVAMEELGVKEQLQCVAASDILIGMHGAGLTYSLMLPENAGVIELFPSWYAAGNYHFLKMAHARRLHYRRWQNLDLRFECDDRSTYVPSGTVKKAIRGIIRDVEISR